MNKDSLFKNSQGMPPGVRDHRVKLVFLTNIVAPYRIALMERLSRVFETIVLYSGEEPNRKDWQTIADQRTGRIQVKKSWGVVFSSFRRRDGGLFDHRFVHITPGYVVDLLRLRPDAIISAELGFRTLVALAYAKLRGVPLWVFWGGTRHTEAKLGSVKRKFRSLLVPRVPRWLSYGLTSTEYLLDLGVPRERVLQMQNCVDELIYQTPVPPYLRAEPKPVVLYVGQLIPRKGVELLLEAAAILQREGFNFSLVIVGSGINAPRIEAQIKKLDLRNTQLVQGVRADQVPAVYRSADLVVYPTLEDVWGLVINEALWSGVPVLASVYAGASRELLTPDHVFDPLNRVDFLAKLRSAIVTGLGTADASRLIKMDAVAELIINDVSRFVDMPPPTELPDA